jgi:hypothetical protein
LAIASWAGIGVPLTVNLSCAQTMLAAAQNAATPSKHFLI